MCNLKIQLAAYKNNLVNDDTHDVQHSKGRAREGDPRHQGVILHDGVGQDDAARHEVRREGQTRGHVAVRKVFDVVVASDDLVHGGATEQRNRVEDVVDGRDNEVVCPALATVAGHARADDEAGGDELTCLDKGRGAVHAAVGVALGEDDAVLDVHAEGEESKPDANPHGGVPHGEARLVVGVGHGAQRTAHDEGDANEETTEREGNGRVLEEARYGVAETRRHAEKLVVVKLVLAGWSSNLGFLAGLGLIGGVVVTRGLRKAVDVVDSVSGLTIGHWGNFDVHTLAQLADRLFQVLHAGVHHDGVASDRRLGELTWEMVRASALCGDLETALVLKSGGVVPTEHKPQVERHAELAALQVDGHGEGVLGEPHRQEDDEEEHKSVPLKNALEQVGACQPLRVGQLRRVLHVRTVVARVVLDEGPAEEPDGHEHGAFDPRRAPDALGDDLVDVTGNQTAVDPDPHHQRDDDADAEPHAPGREALILGYRVAHVQRERDAHCAVANANGDVAVLVHLVLIVVLLPFTFCLYLAHLLVRVERRMADELLRAVRRNDLIQTGEHDEAGLAQPELNARGGDRRSPRHDATAHDGHHGEARADKGTPLENTHRQVLVLRNGLLVVDLVNHNNLVHDVAQHQKYDANEGPRNRCV
eukprot:PhM_4_TR10493/c0_g1_i1/m.88604